MDLRNSSAVRSAPCLVAASAAIFAAACASGGNGKNEGALPVAPAGPPLPAGYELAAARTAAQADGVYRSAVDQAYRKWKGHNEGKNADYIPVLAKVDPNLFGIALVTVQGGVYEIGSARHEFSIQSVSKPFTLARAVEGVGLEAVQKRIGVNATGQAFNSVLAVELNHGEKRPPPGNPLVNAGAIATVDLLPAANVTQKWDVILGMFNAFAGRRLTVNQEVYESESATNTHNRAIVALLKDYEVIKGEPAEALDLYTRQCSVNVTARDLAVMGATLANGGRNPVTNKQVIAGQTASQVLAVMATAGLYETTGEWLVTTGLPAKSGVGGGMVAVMPGRFAVAAFSPPLDEAGNSVRAQKAIASIVERLGGGLFAARAAPRPTAAPVASQPEKPEEAGVARATKEAN